MAKLEEEKKLRQEYYKFGLLAQIGVIDIHSARGWKSDKTDIFKTEYFENLLMIPYLNVFFFILLKGGGGDFILPTTLYLMCESWI